ncbi:nitrogenase-stabilizing/protective protein NifW [Rhodobium gokarnense]|uniref:Nitrogenase-stabilizing/protective protein NifW n=1 Tax=Rhodobium gokarnense TaxID=364296 RepID=A0ABT3H8Y3_9HYPH|nr:nitrogenase-stabilizing/protective protein NifW [Rhodobium gokarnense]MCW2306867.1 nitrogenase-stabilizing/protective protein [Rhodobium gokarnense]
MRNDELEAELEDLSSAEDFLDFFGIAYDSQVVFVNRLHILQRFHDYLEADKDGPTGDEGWMGYYSRHLTTAYQDFVASDARTEKVFKVFNDQNSKPAFVPLDTLLK